MSGPIEDAGRIADRVALAELRARIFGADGPSIRVGRFTVLRTLGSGGMGIVFSAYDEGLDRRVAIKVLRGERVGDVRERRRTLAEARALARLSHPNVVRIYEVGEQAGEVFVVMEYVAGMNLRAWLAAERRTPAQILPLFVQAGRGLAEAHRRGLVHLDFKPDNVLVGDDGVARVVDFGIAQLAATVVELAPGADVVDPGRSSTGLGGTPAYMAPERSAGRAADAGCDQYSFCVALHEALLGALPGSKPPVGAPSSRAVTEAVRRAMQRGLSEDATARFPTMEALLLALQPAARRRRSLIPGLGALTLAVAAVARWASAVEADPVDAGCVELEAAHAEVWNADRSTAAKNALEIHGLPYATPTWGLVERAIETYSAGIGADREALCGATNRADPALAGWVVPRRLACVRRSIARLDAFVRRIEHSDRMLVEHAAAAASHLRRDVEHCDETGLLASAIGEGPSSDAHESRVLERVAEVDLDLHFGRYEAARAGALEAERAARRSERGDLRAQAAQRVAIVTALLGDHARAEELLADAYRQGLAAGDKRVATATALALVEVVGERQARHDEALVRASYAQALLGDLREDAEARAELERLLGGIHTERARFDLAAVHYRAAIDALAGAPDSDPLQLARVLLGRARLRVDQQEFDGAQEDVQRALEALERSLGPDHPALIAALIELGRIRSLRIQYFGARAPLERALAVGVAGLGPDHPILADAHAQLGHIAYRIGELDDAEEHHRRALAIRSASLPADHPDVAQAHGRLGLVLMRRGHLAAAEGEIAGALTSLARSLGPDHPDLTIQLINLAEVHRLDRRWSSAERELDAALRLVIRHHGRAHTSLLSVLKARRMLAEDMHDRAADRAAQLWSEWIVRRTLADAPPASLLRAHHSVSGIGAPGSRWSLVYSAAQNRIAAARRGGLAYADVLRLEQVRATTLLQAGHLEAGLAEFERLRTRLPPEAPEIARDVAVWIERARSELVRTRRATMDR